MEHKLLTLSDVDLKFADTGSFEGYASTFNGVDSYGDTVLPGAFADTIKNRQRPIRMFLNHMSKLLPIGKWTSAEEDGKGLRMRGQLTPGLSIAEDVKAAMLHQTMDGLSIGYRIPPGGSAKEGKIRQLKRIDLVEVSVVTAPADLNALIDPESIKSAIDEIRNVNEFEDFLRDAGGFSRSAAKALVSQVKGFILRDVEMKREAEALASILATSWPKSLKG
jgi:uncharacterized protein